MGNFYSMRQFLSGLFRNSFIQNSFILFTGTMIGNVLNYIFHLAIGRMVSPIAYGEIESLISLLAVISVPAAALTLVATKYAANMKAEGDTAGVRLLARYLTGRVLLYGTPLLLLAGLVTPWVKDFLNIDSSLPIFFLWGVMALSFLGAILAGILTGWQKFGSINVVGIVSTVLKLVAAILFVWLGFGVSGVVGSYALAMLSGYLLSWFFLKRYFYEQKDAQVRNLATDFSSLKSYALPAFYGMLSMAILGNADMIFAKHHLEPSLSGEYGALFVVSKTIFFVTGVLTTVLFAMSVEESRKQPGSTHTFRMATVLTILTASVSALFFFIFPQFVMGVFFGQKYLSASPLLGWFALSAGLYSIANLFLQYLLSLQRTGVTSLFLALSGLEIAILFFFGEGIYAIIAITIGVQVLAVLLGSFFVLKEKHHAQTDFYSHSGL